MKLQADRSNSLTINAYSEGWIEVNGVRFTHSLIVSSLPGALPSLWDVSGFKALKSANFEELCKSETEVVIFGSGRLLRFPQSAWLAPLIGQKIGLETMDTAAACRTYNILASEGRKVVAALLLET